MNGFDSGGPIYRQIADQYAADILSGRLAPDEQVMSTNQYTAFYHINPATAAKAFQHLVDDGLLYKKRGIGMFVSADRPTVCGPGTACGSTPTSSIRWWPRRRSSASTSTT